MAEDDSSSSVEIMVSTVNGEAYNSKMDVSHMDDCDDDLQPYIAIVEQPQSRGFRFRYECEGPSHGGLQGERSEKYRRSFPSIKIQNYNGPAKIFVKLVTTESIPRPHAHKLVGKNCQDGVCVTEIKSGNTVNFPNLCIQHVTRRKAADVIEQRIHESLKLDKLVKMGDLNAEADLTDDEKRQAKEQAVQAAKDMQLNVVKLCFQAYLKDENGTFSRLLTPVLSTAIYDSKAPGANALKICRMDKYGGCCSGGEEVFLLCEKVQKDDIAVRFVEQDDDGNISWESFGNFGPFDVHRQYAIVFKTPAYHNQRISRPVNVTIMLQRKSDQETSDPKSFTYYPQTFDKEEIEKKRKKPLPNYPGGGGFTGGGEGGLHGTPNGQMNGTSSSFPPTQGNLPGIISESEQNLPVHHSSHSSKAANKRAKRTLKVDLELDGGQEASVGIPATISSINSKPVSSFNFGAQSISGFPAFQQAGAYIQTSGGPQYIMTQQGMVTGPPMDSQFAFSNPTPQTMQQQQQNFFNTYSTQTAGMYSQQGHTQGLLTQGLLPRGGASSSKDKLLVSRGALKERNSNLDELDSCPVSSSGQSEMLVPRGVGNIDTKVNSRGHSTLLGDLCNGEEAVPGTSENDNKIKDTSLAEKEISVDCDVSPTERGTSVECSVHNRCDVECQTLVSHGDIQETSCQTETQTSIDQNVRVCPVEVQHVSVQTETDNVTKTAERTVKALQMYASTGDIRQLLMVQRYLTSVCDDNGDLPLHTSIINGQLEVVHNLLDVMETLPNAWMKLNAYNNILQTPLHLAVLTHQAGITDRLLCSGANPSLPDRHGNTAAHLAVMFGSLECLKTLLKYQRPGVTKANPFPEILAKNFSGLTPLHLAAQKGDMEALKCLIRGKADINVPDGKSGRTALHHAVEVEDLSVAGYLILEAGASVNAQCFNGNTALHIACGRQNLGMVALLMAAGADKNIENSEELIVTDNEGSGSDDDQGQTDTSKIKKEGSLHRGHKPEDYAMDNHKILRVLHGEPYTNGSTMEREVEDRSYSHTTQMFTSLSMVTGHHDESGLGSIGYLEQGGDVDRLVYPVRVQLSKLLDPARTGHDWVELADRLGLRKAIEGQHTGFSPTRLLLTYYESCGGTIQRLLEALYSIGRQDAIYVINDFLKNNESIHQSRRIQVDSGIDSHKGIPLHQMTAT
ncbi:hypothetical protein FSP39_020963 [Pinctada imbricata]|uniref:RHD domain-containing protein n=1 Tax=Pinctada imbricata TaxID=66713 RepID=A0AA89BQF8_PINIB|nr:hypothetical protein FSP39_020963 [Pinctada imbricata]